MAEYSKDGKTLLRVYASDLDKSGAFVIPNGVEDIAPRAFDVSCVKSVTIPGSIKKIGCVFGGLPTHTLVSVNILDGVEEIGEGAFWNCEALRKVTIGKSVKSVGKEAFELCKSLKSITIPNGVKTIQDKAFSYCESLGEVHLQDGVEEIGSLAFANCKSLKSIEFPNSIKKICDRAFPNCESLVAVKIPKSVKEIGEYAFAGCRHLKEVELAEGIEKIGMSAFTSCAIKSITLPDTICNVGIWALGPVKTVNCSEKLSTKLGSQLGYAIDFGKKAKVNIYESQKALKDDGRGGK